MSVFKEISRHINSFHELQTLATRLFPEEGSELFKQFRGPVVKPLAFDETSRRVFEVWLEEHKTLTFQEKKQSFSAAMEDTELESIWEG